MKFDNFAAILYRLVEHKKIQDEYIDSIPEDIRCAFFDNEYSISQSLCLDKVLTLVLDTYIYEEIQWFIYDWQPGFTITVDNHAPYTIFTIEDYLEYVKEHYEWE